MQVNPEVDLVDREDAGNGGSVARMLDDVDLEDVGEYVADSVGAVDDGQWSFLNGCPGDGNRRGVNGKE